MIKFLLSLSLLTVCTASMADDLRHFYPLECEVVEKKELSPSGAFMNDYIGIRFSFINTDGMKGSSYLRIKGFMPERTGPLFYDPAEQTISQEQFENNSIEKQRADWARKLETLSAEGRCK